MNILSIFLKYPNFEEFFNEQNKYKIRVSATKKLINGKEYQFLAMKNTFWVILRFLDVTVTGTVAL